MKQLELIPFFRITMLFIIGVVLGRYALFALLLLIFRRFRREWILVVLILSGGLIKFIDTTAPTLPSEQKIELIVALEDSSSNYFKAKVLSNSPHSYMLIQKESGLSKGDTVAANFYLEDIDKYHSDFKSALRSYKMQGIKQVGYIYRENRVDRAALILPQNRVNRLRKFIVDRVSSLSIAQQDRAVLKALLVGDRGELSPKTSVRYRKAGVMHALAVSGMHVGIIFMMLNVLFRFLNAIRLLRVVKVLIIILVLIFYALLCGATPSVVRAVIMFSIFQLCSFTLTSRYHAYNILFLAAFLMIAINPNIIWNVSFQLSYFAMFGIIYSSSISEHTIVEGASIRRNTIMLFTTTIFITLFMLPLSLYYFSEGTFFAAFSNILIALLLPPLFIASWLWVVFDFHFFEVAIDTIFSFINFIIDLVGRWDIFYLRFVVFDIYDLLLSYFAIGLIMAWGSITEKKIKIK
ncbi:MAG: ComEC/Rec2 family competence protein [Rikenellaceae bacterium]